MRHYFDELYSIKLQAIKRSPLDPGHINALCVTHLPTFNKLMQEFEQERAKLAGSQIYTVDGKREKLVELSRATHKKISEARGAIGYDAAVSEKRRALQQKAQDSEGFVDGITRGMAEIVKELRAQDIRRELKGLDPILLQAAYTEAAENGNRTFLDAVDGDPLGRPLVPKKVQEAGRATLLKTAFPERTKEVEELESVCEELDLIVDAAYQSLRPFLGGPIEDKLAAAAAGTGRAA